MVFERIKRFFESHHRGSNWPSTPRSVTFDDTSVTISEVGHPDCRFEWANVTEVFAYKIDLFSFDEVCIGFRYDNNGGYEWIGESYIGFNRLVEHLPKQFQGIKTDWFTDIAYPAFVENRTTLWGEPWTQNIG